MNTNMMVLNYSFTRKVEEREKGNDLTSVERTLLFDEGLSRQRKLNQLDAGKEGGIFIQKILT